MSSKLPERVAAKSKPQSNSTKIPTSGKTNGSLSRSSSACTLTSVADAKSEHGDNGGDITSEFIVGDHIFVNGSKPGIVKYIGETQFAPGLWAGVMLDDAVGKNDGSVGGVRYFDCEPKKGIFTRPHRLTREACPSHLSGDVSVGETSPTPPKVKSTGVTPKSAGSAPIPPGSVTPNRISVSSKLKVGEKVVVNATSGAKLGVLRYIGAAEFAPGDWAGIELDEPIGKNDGSVAGKRYFTCKTKHGLFAPLHKVVPKSGQSTPRLCSAGTSPLHQRSNSRESLNSSLSSSSAARVGRVKLGVTSLTNTQKSTRSAATTVTATNTALQETLKEKEEHVEQLLKERDLERAEVARAASQVDEVEQKLAQLQLEHQRYVEESEENITHLKNLLEVSDSEMKTIKPLLEDEKRKVEDLQFRIEEETIAKSDLEVLLQQERQKLKLLEECVQKDKSQNLEKSSSEATALSLLLKEKDTAINSLESKLSNVSRGLALRDKQIAELTSSLERSKQELGELLSQSAEQQILKDRVYKLENELNVAVQNKAEAVQAAKHEIDALEKRLSEKEGMLTSLQHSTEEKDSLIQNLSTELSETKGKLQETETSGNALLEVVAQLKAASVISIKEKDEKIKALTEELEQAALSLKAKESSEVESENHMTMLRNSLNAKDGIIGELKSQLSNMEQTIQQLQKESSDCITSLEKNIEQIKEENQMLITEHEKKTQQLSDDLKRASESLELKMKECLAKQAEVSDLQKVIEEKGHELAKHESLLSDANKQLALTTEQMKEEENQLMSKVAELEKSLKEVELKTLQLSEDLKCASESLELKTKECLAKQTEVSDLQHVVEGKDQELAKCESLLAEANKQLALIAEQMKEKEDQLMSKVAELENNLKEGELKTIQLYEELKTASESLELKTKECSVKQDEISVLQKTVEEKGQELMKHETLLQDAKVQIDVLKEEGSKNEKQLMNKVFELEKDSKDKEEKLQQLFDENKRLTTEVKEKADILKENEQIALSLEKSLKEKDISYAKLSTQLQDAQKELMILSKDKTETHGLLQQQIAQIRCETDELLREKDKQFEGLQQEVSDLKQTIQEKTSAVAEKESQIMSLKKDMQEREVEVCELTAIIQDSQMKFELLTEQSNKNSSAFDTKLAELKAEQERLLNQKEELWKLETEKLSNLIKEKDSELQENKSQLSTTKSLLEEKDARVKSLELQIEESRVHLQSLAKNDIALHNDLEAKISSLQNQCDRLQKEKEELAKLQQESQELQKNLEKEKDHLVKDNIEHKAAVQDREAKLDSVQLEVNRMKIEFADHKADLQQKLDVSEMELKALRELKEQLELQHGVLEDLQKELQTSENEKNNLLSQLQQIESLIEEKNLLEKKHEESQKLIEDLTANKVELEKKSRVFEKLLESNQCLLQSKEKEFQQVNKQLEPLQKEAILSEKLKITVKRLEEEKFILEDKIKKLQSAAPITSSYGDISESGMGKEEKDALLTQVDFLNSIIVDMRNKNDELNARIAVLEAGPVFEENDLNLNGIKRTIAPRLFCDICDMFDLHDTEDCPKQSNFDEDEEIPHSRHHGNRYEERPYCSNCEVFGHWTENCDDQETF